MRQFQIAEGQHWREMGLLEPPGPLPLLPRNRPCRGSFGRADLSPFVDTKRCCLADRCPLFFRPVTLVFSFPFSRCLVTYDSTVAKECSKHNKIKPFGGLYRPISPTTRA